MKCCLNNRNKEYDAIVAEPVEPSEIINQTNDQIDENLMTLPLEIIMYILEILDYQGKLKPKFLRVSKLIYEIALPLIYKSPKLKATNFFSFVEAMSLKRNFGDHVQQLDLSYIIQTGKNAYVAKLLKRSRKKLSIFIAPQTSFGLGPTIALKNCEHLRVLDLRLVSETLNLEELFRSIRTLKELTHLSFPRSSIEVSDCGKISWPPKLSFLRLSGGISDDFLSKSNFPATITQIEFSHCPAVKHDGFENILRRFGNNLTSLKVQYPMPGLKDNSLDSVFRFCPHLTYLEVAVDYLSNTFFDEENLPYLPFERPLRSLYIDSSGMLGTSNKIDAIDLAIALSDDRLPCLKNVSCTVKLGWDPKSEYVTYIVDALDEKLGGLYMGY